MLSSAQVVAEDYLGKALRTTEELQDQFDDLHDSNWLFPSSESLDGSNKARRQHVVVIYGIGCGPSFAAVRTILSALESGDLYPKADLALVASPMKNEQAEIPLLQAPLCAAAQGKERPFILALLGRNPRPKDVPELRALARSTLLDVKAFAECMNGRESYLEALRRVAFSVFSSATVLPTILIDDKPVGVDEVLDLITRPNN